MTKEEINAEVKAIIKRSDLWSPTDSPETVATLMVVTVLMSLGIPHQQVPVAVRPQLYATILEGQSSASARHDSGILSYVVDVKAVADRVDGDLTRYRNAMGVIVEDESIQGWWYDISWHAHPGASNCRPAGPKHRQGRTARGRSATDAGGPGLCPRVFKARTAESPGLAQGCGRKRGGQAARRVTALRFLVNENLPLALVDPPRERGFEAMPVNQNMSFRYSR